MIVSNSIKDLMEKRDKQEMVTRARPKTTVKILKCITGVMAVLIGLEAFEVTNFSRAIPSDHFKINAPLAEQYVDAAEKEERSGNQVEAVKFWIKAYRKNPLDYDICLKYIKAAVNSGQQNIAIYTVNNNDNNIREYFSYRENELRGTIQKITHDWRTIPRCSYVRRNDEVTMLPSPERVELDEQWLRLRRMASPEDFIPE